jgi:hypothetical protein
MQDLEVHEKSEPRASSHDTSDIEAVPADGKVPSNDEVNWDGANDQMNPMNWGTSRKLQNLGIISVMSLST